MRLKRSKLQVSPRSTLVWSTVRLTRQYSNSVRRVIRNYESPSFARRQKQVRNTRSKEEWPWIERARRDIPDKKRLTQCQKHTPKHNQAQSHIVLRHVRPMRVTADEWPSGRWRRPGVVHPWSLQTRPRPLLQLLPMPQLAYPAPIKLLVRRHRVAFLVERVTV